MLDKKGKTIRLGALLEFLGEQETETSSESPHLTDEQVFGFIGDALPAGEREQVGRHLALCAKCANDLAELQHEFDEWEVEAGPVVNPVIQCRKEVASMNEKRSVSLNYFDQHLHIDAEVKKKLGHWVVKQFPLEEHAGVFLDAGSQAFYVWQDLYRLLKKKNLRNIHVLSNSYPILKHWVESQRRNPVLGTSLDLAGGVFDDRTLAFYGVQEKKKLSSMTLSHLYIGAVGVEISDKGKLLLGYQSVGGEADSKKLLFEASCEKRIVLATSRKIGYAGAKTLDVLDFHDKAHNAPIYLISDTPETKDQEVRFERFRYELEAGKLRAHLDNRGITFTWYIVDCHGREPQLQSTVPDPKAYVQIAERVDAVEQELRVGKKMLGK